MIEVTIISLVALNAFQLFYWMRETHRLIDKIMSKSYPEYVSSVSYLKPKPTPSPGQEVDSQDTIQEQEILRELNGMVGP